MKFMAFFRGLPNNSNFSYTIGTHITRTRVLNLVPYARDALILDLRIYYSCKFSTGIRDTAVLE
jgi:hypothetical protein